MTAVTGNALTLDSALTRPHVVGAPTALTTAAPTGNQGAIGGAPNRIPIEANDSAATPVDHFIPGIAADPTSSGTQARLGLYYYFYPQADCVFANPGGNQCDLNAGYVSSADGGQTWSSPTRLADMTLADVARTSQGPMVGDYSQATVLADGRHTPTAISAFAVGPSENMLDEDMYVAPDGGLPMDGGAFKLDHPEKAAVEQAQAAPAQAHPAVPPRFLGR